MPPLPTFYTEVGRIFFTILLLVSTIHPHKHEDVAWSKKIHDAFAVAIWKNSNNVTWYFLEKSGSVIACTVSGNKRQTAWVVLRVQREMKTL